MKSLLERHYASNACIKSNHKNDKHEILFKDLLSAYIVLLFTLLYTISLNKYPM